ncbi:MAG: single-stranded DNA-binding protein [Oscillospiraceae bacterium]|nr:single-stranded DNA-binding protein [Oscillospiraceae bacterium]
MLNKVILMGRLVREPELRHTQEGVPVVSFALAVDRGFRRDEQNADFINIVAWRGTAEFVSKWLSKGQLVAVSGRLQVRTYKDRDGNNKDTVEVVVDEVFFGEGKRGGEISYPIVMGDSSTSSE